MEILQKIRKVETQAVSETEEAQEEIPEVEKKSAKQSKEQFKASNPDIKYKDLQKMIFKALKAQRKRKSPWEKKIMREADKAEKNKRDTEDDEVIVALLHAHDTLFLKHLREMSNANIALKAYIEKKKIAMGLGGEYGGQPETEDQANGRIHRTLESKFTSNARPRSVGRPSRAAGPSNNKTDAKPGWMRNLGM